jgi:hypothetical protein
MLPGKKNLRWQACSMTRASIAVIVTWELIGLEAVVREVCGSCVR